MQQAVVSSPAGGRRTEGGNWLESDRLTGHGLSQVGQGAGHSMVTK